MIKNLLKRNIDLIAVLMCCIALLFIASVDCLIYLRWVVGFLFVFFLSGYPLSVVFFPVFNSIKKSERLLMSIGFSLLLTYPAGVINVLIEGKSGEAIYGPHLIGSLSALTGLTFIMAIIAYIRRKKTAPIEKTDGNNRPYYAILLGIILLISIFFNFTNLNRADLNGDEYDLGYVAYDLVDGTVAGRNGYMLSSMGHSPLSMFINHFSMQILDDSGFETIDDWMIRFGYALTGVLCVLALYILGREIFNEKIALLASLMLAVSNYHVWMSRLAMREMFMTFFMIICAYFLFKMMKAKGVSHPRNDLSYSPGTAELSGTEYAILSGIFFGALLLVKMTGLFLAPVIFIFIILYKNKYKTEKPIKKMLVIFATAFLVFSPVIIYNIGAYVATGYMDIFFSRIFGLYHPYGYTGDKSHTVGESLHSELTGIFELLIDQYSLILFAVFFAPIIYAIAFIKKTLKEPAVIWQILLTITILGFFILTGTRAYYMPFITVPLALSTAYFLEKAFRNKYLKIPTILIFATTIFYSSFYTYNTNISEAYSVDDKWIDSGRTGYEELVPQPLTYQYSRSARAWSENRGWKNLKLFLEENITENDLLIIDDDLDTQMLENYLDIGKYVKNFYLGDAYKERYKHISLSEFLNNPQTGYIITTANAEFTYEFVATIYDTAGNPRFNIYKVK